ncbi:hypothetical protein DFR30_2886 [Thiogranum longum]|uniref:Nitrogen fixation protein FixH n=1 Tax=Thiogranum longum TaxID=1537524 RepID=A0A4R1HQG4_9GAMM|nr:FixH family protein [Thiogranum longum]TCK19572.1 hypothetical protein DFR30_2886 [Thiogranum longum]
MQKTTVYESSPWYRKAWPGLLFIPPVGAVLGGILTIVLAVQSPHALVVDDYYKEGLAINQHKHRLEMARDAQLDALLRSDGSQITLSLRGKKIVDDGALVLQFIHATRAELDRSVKLETLGEGHYAAPSPDLPTGVWYLRLRPADNRWEIRARIKGGRQFQARLSSDEL